MTSIHRRDLLKLAALAGATPTLLARPALAQAPAWPTKNVLLTVGYPPGGLTDAGARAISQGMGKRLGQQVIVDNKPGASGNIGASEVLRAPADGHRLLVANTSFTINPHTFVAPSPDPNAFTPVGLILESQLVLCVHPSSPARDLASFIDWVRKDTAAGGFSYASAGSGGNTHLAMEYFRECADLTKMNQVAYKGSAPAIQDLTGNQVPCLIDAASLLIPYIASGRLRPIFVTGADRLPALPDVPTAVELGVKNYVVTVFVGLWGPPKLPREIVSRANEAMNSALADPNVSGLITKNGDLVGGGTPEKLGEITRENFRLWGDIVRKNDIKAT